MKWILRILLFLIACFALAIFIATFKHSIWPWFEVHTGTWPGATPYYGFWSGFGSDIGEATIIVGIYMAWRHHNCHHPWCWRSGKEVEGTPYIACHIHHPRHEFPKRAVTDAQMLAAWKAAHPEDKEDS